MQTVGHGAVKKMKVGATDAAEGDKKLDMPGTRGYRDTRAHLDGLITRKESGSHGASDEKWSREDYNRMQENPKTELAANERE